MQKAIIARTTKTPRQNVLQNKPQEVFAFERAHFDLLRLAVDIPKRYVAIVIGHDILLADHAAIQIAGQVFQCRLAFADMLAIGYPARRHTNGDG